MLNRSFFTVSMWSFQTLPLDLPYTFFGEQFSHPAWCLIGRGASADVGAPLRARYDKGCRQLATSYIQKGGCWAPHRRWHGAHELFMSSHMCRTRVRNSSGDGLDVYGQYLTAYSDPSVPSVHDAIFLLWGA